MPATCHCPGSNKANPCPTSHFLKIHLNIAPPPSIPDSSKWSLSLRFPHQNPVHSFPLPIRATCPAHVTLLYLITRTIFGEQFRSLSSSLCSFLHFTVTSSIIGPNTIRSYFYKMFYVHSVHSRRSRDVTVTRINV